MRQNPRRHEGAVQKLLLWNLLGIREAHSPRRERERNPDPEPPAEAAGPDSRVLSAPKISSRSSGFTGSPTVVSPISPWILGQGLRTAVGQGLLADGHLIKRTDLGMGIVAQLATIARRRAVACPVGTGGIQLRLRVVDLAGWIPAVRQVLGPPTGLGHKIAVPLPHLIQPRALGPEPLLSRLYSTGLLPARGFVKKRIRTHCVVENNSNGGNRIVHPGERLRLDQPV